MEINLQVHCGSRSALAISQVDVLTALSEGETADRQMRRRKEQAIDMLVRLGDAALPLSEKDAVRFHDLPRDWTAQAATAVTYLEKAQRLGDSSPDVAGLLALAMSVSARQADATEAWTKIAQYADQSAGKLGRRERSDAAKSTAGGAICCAWPPRGCVIRATQPRNRQAIITLATLLKQSFRDDALKNTNVDRGVLENIVLPGLSLPLEAGDAPAAELAALSAAKGRLISGTRASRR